MFIRNGLFTKIYNPLSDYIRMPSIMFMRIDYYNIVNKNINANSVCLLTVHQILILLKKTFNFQVIHSDAVG